MSPIPSWYAKTVFQILKFYLKAFLSYPFFNIHLSLVLLQWFYSLAQAVTSQAENSNLLKRVLIE